ncbi:putative peptidase [Citreicella sp. SE45]|nr:putative peptidase [Citreicella sp. SE45]
MIKTLSTEFERFDRERSLVDPWAIANDAIGRPVPDELHSVEYGDPKITDFPPRDIITTDRPGPYGYNPSDYDHVPKQSETHYEIGSLFCRFAGTSASTALAAGLVSLAIAVRKVDGGDAREADKGARTMEAPSQVQPDRRPFDLAAADRLIAVHS